MIRNFTATHYQILQSIELGKNTFTGIHDYTNIPIATLSLYLSQLINNELVSKKYVEGRIHMEDAFSIKKRCYDLTLDGKNSLIALKFLFVVLPAPKNARIIYGNLSFVG